MDTFSHYVHLFQRFVYINNYNLLQTTMIITYQKKDCKYFFEKIKEILRMDKQAQVGDEMTQRNVIYSKTKENKCSLETEK